MDWKQKERELEYRCIGLEAGKKHAIEKNLGPAIIADYDFKLTELRKESEEFYNQMEEYYANYIED